MKQEYARKHWARAAINLGVSQVLKVGKSPISIQVGGRYYVEGPSGAPDWGLRCALTLPFPTGKHDPAPPAHSK